MLDIKGEDIIALGYSGKEVGRVLSYLLEGVILGKTQNAREALLEFAKSYTDNR